MRSTRLLMSLCLILGSGLALNTAQAAGPESFTLRSGLKVILMPQPASEVVSLNLVTPHAYDRASDAKAGLEQMMLDLLPKGSRTHDKAYFDRELDRRGASLDGDVQRDYSRFSLHTVKPFFKDVLALYVEALATPRFDAQEMEHTRQNMISAVRAKLDYPESHLALALNNTYFTGHPYHADVDGTEDSLKALGQADLQTHHGLWMQVPGRFLVVVGPFTKQELQRDLEAALGTLVVAGVATSSETPALTPPSAFVRVEETIPTRYITARFVAPRPGDTQYAPLNLAMKVLRDRLWDNVRTKGGLAYAISSRLNLGSAAFGTLYIVTTDEQAAMPRALDDVRRLTKESVPADELAAAKSVTTTEFYMGAQSTTGLAAQLINAELYFGGYEQYRALIDGMRRATPDEVREASARYLKNFVYGVLGKQETLNVGAFVQP